MGHSSSSDSKWRKEQAVIGKSASVKSNHSRHARCLTMATSQLSDLIGKNEGLFVSGHIRIKERRRKSLAS